MTDGRPPHLVAPAGILGFISAKGGGWGRLDLKLSVPENLLVVARASDRDALCLPATDTFLDTHFTRRHAEKTAAGLWYRVNPELHEVWASLRIRGDVSIETETFRSYVIPDAWKVPPANSPLLVFAVSETDGRHACSAWWIAGPDAFAASFEVVDSETDTFAFIEDQWPATLLRSAEVTVIGVGSIGSSAAMTLAGAGVGALNLVDPDRLQHHNVVRHVLNVADVGRFKVTALRDHIRARYPHVTIRPLVRDVERDADEMRPLFRGSDIVVVASDGVLSRRVANHLAFGARKPVVFAAVLEDGAIGEVLRLRPQDACLLCVREWAVVNGLMDPEPKLDAEYGTGTAHRPMTAAPSDLRLMGDLAGKAALATLLERAGYRAQRLPEGWQLIGLQPNGDLLAPFDVERAGEVKWLPLPGRQPGCLSCGRQRF